MFSLLGSSTGVVQIINISSGLIVKEYSVHTGTVRSVHMSIFLSMCLSICLSVCPLQVKVHPSIFLSVCLSIISQSVCLSICSSHLRHLQQSKRSRVLSKIPYTRNRKSGEHSRALSLKNKPQYIVQYTTVLLYLDRNTYYKSCRDCERRWL